MKAQVGGWSGGGGEGGEEGEGLEAAEASVACAVGERVGGSGGLSLAARWDALAHAYTRVRRNAYEEFKGHEGASGIDVRLRQ